MAEEETSKEMQDIIDALDRYVKKHQGKVCIHAGIYAFNGPEFDIIDDRILAYGSKKAIKISIDEMSKELDNEKEEFVNW